MNLIYFSKFFVFCIDNIVGNIEVFNMKKKKNHHAFVSTFIVVFMLCIDICST